ncbi:uncharacterized protein LOC133320757 [Danaus plexippus]|uniref:uncharacterized protein LOC133320757 n=1 Tax=Danaus plexippus TaxID=13037 RepID=UPI002AB09505|nr:uncharacterized protein LOC133320757 [Danaus plexippus]
MTSLSKFQLDSPAVTLLSPEAISNVPFNGFEISRVRCQIHPSVIISMLNAHNRLSELYGFAIGTLLGSVSIDPNNINNNGVIVDIADCFANPFHYDSASNSLNIQREPHEWMLRLREKINPKLVVVGWCCTSRSMTYPTAISEWAQIEQKTSRFFPTKLLPEPVHLLIDPLFTNSDSLLGGTKEKKIPADPQIGRKLMEAVSVKTLLPKKQLKTLLEESIQDNLLIAYLLNLARLQFIVAETIAGVSNQQQ